MPRPEDVDFYNDYRKKLKNTYQVRGNPIGSSD